MRETTYSSRGSGGDVLHGGHSDGDFVGVPVEAEGEGALDWHSKWNLSPSTRFCTYYYFYRLGSRGLF